MSFDAHRDENASESILDVPDDIDMARMRAMWMAILKRTVRDAASKRLVPIRHNAQWCEVMCELAGIEMTWFQKQVRRSL